MSRPLPLQLPGGIYHVTARGNARRSIFEDDDDCARFLIVLASTVARYRVLCHAYCLMGNHYHLLVQTPEPNLSVVMRQLNGVYTQRFNRRHERVAMCCRAASAPSSWTVTPTCGKSAGT
jgi:putative transposase